MFKLTRLALPLVAVVALLSSEFLVAAKPNDVYSAPGPASGHVVAPVVSDVGTVDGADSNRETYVPGELIVKFKPGIDASTVDEDISNHGGKVKQQLLLKDHWLVSVPADKNLSEVAGALRQNPHVEIVEPNAYCYASFTPNDSYYNLQWNFPIVQVPQAWDTANGNGVIVAVVDTGIAFENYGAYLQAPDLANTAFVSGWDFINNDSHPDDDYGHGTHVAGTIAQSTNNSLGTAGIAYGAKLMPVKVLDSTGSGTDITVGDGIKWATDNGAKVINLSLGSTAPSTYMESAVNYAHDHGVVVVAAAGNSNSAINYPAAYTNAIAVGAIRYDQTKTYYSNYGPQLALVAPGGDSSVDQNGDGYPDGILQQTFASGNPTSFGYYFYDGTSMATPHVAAVAALVIAAGVASTPDQVRQVLQSTAKDLGTPGWDQYYGYGLVQAYNALHYSASNPTPTATNTPTPTPTNTTTANQNLALGKPVTVSSIETTGYEGSKAVDGSMTTRWSSAYADNQWITIDLGVKQGISNVILNWETAYGKDYLIQVSDDGTTWQTVYTRTGGTGGTENLAVSGAGRYVRMYGQIRGTQWGFSLWEFQVYGSNTGIATPTSIATATNTSTPTPTSTSVATITPTPTSTGVATATPTATPSPTSTPIASQNLALNKAVKVSSTDSSGHRGQKAVDGNTSTRWASDYLDNQWIYVDLGAKYNISKVVLNWATAYGSSYQIQTSDDGSTWQTIYTRTGGTGGKETLAVSGAGRYVRMYGLTRGTQSGFSLWEFEVYGYQ